jgi:hypothetical protein
VLLEDWYYLALCDMGIVYYEKQLLTGVYLGQTETVSAQISAVQRQISRTHRELEQGNGEWVWKAPQRENAWNLWNALNIATTGTAYPTCFSHIDQSNGSCNKTATSIPIDTLCMCACPISFTALN